ncbi:TIGR01459 family HAD-type hydrolase [Neogemmobacter tilapiae]|uniref:Haloacid dehalogenase n=1 Tax=Neogemmobacter tilapiae TaxID=875041 RepID=A0A918THQ8_9RHOB|nr:TIGR01459 family HAD-type hydrolase [Gemmobacter tilapiae]GHC47367.1 haloacid dehalogenase [Gemmobacter tilapiae]
MTEVIASLAGLDGRYRALFCDLWGCLHDGKRPYPAAVAALQAFRAGGGRVILVTNSPRPRSDVIRQLDGLGVPRDAWDDIASSGDAAQYAALTGAVGFKVHHIGGPKDESFFSELSEDLKVIAAQNPALERVALAQAEGLIVTGLRDDQTETPEDYRAELLLAKTNGLTLLCANPDIIVDIGEKRVYCAGALAQAYEEMGGEALYFGKPHPPIYDLARRRLAALNGGVIDDAEILCVGDGISTDVLGGQQEGLDSLFITGGLAHAEFGADVENPDALRLQDYLDAREQVATYAMGRLR